LLQQSPFNDASLDKIFDRFKSRFAKIFGKDMKRIDPSKFRDKEFQDLYEFIGVDMPEESEDPFLESPTPSRDQRYGITSVPKALLMVCPIAL
jgi:hypothetical protein